ncbi:MAG: hypothetical protein JWR17_4382 [Pseudomonas sp.]|nr:hypothetical protein [Pseudomonas sp.]
MNQLIFNTLFLRENQSDHYQSLIFKTFVENAIAVMVQLTIVGYTEKAGLGADRIGEGVFRE